MAEETTLPETDAPEAPAGGESLRDDVARAFDEVETREAPQTPPAAAPQQGTPAATTDERPRDASGRFTAAPKAAEKPVAPSTAAPAPTPTPPPKAEPAPPQQPQLRPPPAWKPAIREHWTKLAPEVQAEIHRREVEITKSLQESQQARQALTAVQQVLQPYMQNIQATGGDALAQMKNLFQADHTLRHGSPVDKAHFIASIIKGYGGVDIQTLDSALASQGSPAADPNANLMHQIQQAVNAQLQPVLGFFNQMQGRQQEMKTQIDNDAVNDVQTFGQDAAHEFFDDVRQDMANIMDLASARGEIISLQDAYDYATKVNPHVSEIVAKRAETERAAAAAQAAQRARRTAVSVSGSPAPAGSPGPNSSDSLRSTIEQAWDQHTSR